MKISIIFNLFFICLSMLESYGQDKEATYYTVSGKVMENDGSLLPGVSIYIKNEPGVGVITTVNGQFTIKVPKNEQLVFSFVGYKKYEYLVTKNISGLKVVLEEEKQHLEEVVIVGHGEQKKASVVGAISTINVEQLQIPSSSISNIIGGRIPGIISVTRSGEPGDDFSEFWVRGISTFGGGEGALVLIDGVEGNLNDLDPADIESFSVLKDASATAVYGVRGANGVILVTTKQGTAGKININLKTSATLSYSPRMPKYLRAYDYARLANEAREVRGLSSRYDEVELEIIRNHMDPDLYPDVDWREVILKDFTWNNQHYLSVSGGGATARYFLSAGIQNKSAVFKEESINKYNTNVNWHKYTFRANVSANLTKTSIVNLALDGTIVKQNSPGYGDDNNALWTAQSNLTPVTVPVRYSNGLLPAYGSNDNQISPYVLLNYTGFKTTQRNTMKVNFGLNQDLGFLLKGLKANALFSFTNNSNHVVNRYKIPSLYKVLGHYNDGSLVMAKTVNEVAMSYKKTANIDRTYYFEGRLNYARTFDRHRVTGLLHYYMQDFQDSKAANETAAIPKRYQALSGRITYALDDRYLVETNFGYTGSENFKKGEQFGFFPAIAMGWVPSEYSWFKDRLGFINFLKIRASYGEVGNDRIIKDRRFPYITYVQLNNVSKMWGDPPAIQEGQIGADNLSWEVAKKYNLGIDARMWHDRINLTFEFFKDIRDGIFQERQMMPVEVGAMTNPWTNVGSMRNRGVEGNIEYSQEIKKEMSVTLRSNFTYAINKVKHWDEAVTYPYQSKSNKPNGIYRGLIAMGLFRDSLEIISSPKQDFGKVRPGDIRYKDVNGDGHINSDDEVALEYSKNPQIMYGFAAEFRYKGLTVGAFFRGAGKVQYLKFGNAYRPYNFQEQGNILKSVAKQSNRWTPAWYSGDPSTENPNAAFPRLTYGTSENNSRTSTFWLGNGRYLKLQNVDISYTLRHDALSRWGIANIVFHVVGTNLACWDKIPDKITDPEQAIYNGEKYPIQRTFTFQLSVNF